MKYFNFALFGFVLLSVFMISCSKESVESQDNISGSQVSEVHLADKSNYITSISIGEQHNIIVHDFLNSNTGLKNLDYLSRKNLMIDWFQENYGWDSAIFHRFDEFETGSPKNLAGFSPIEYITVNESNLNPYFYTQIQNVLSSTYAVRTSLADIQMVITSAKINAESDINFATIEDKQRFLDMLDVFEKSSGLWFTYDFSHNDNFEDEVASEIEPWKIAASDFVGGAIAGLWSAGSLALPGLVGASAQYVIGAW